MMSINEGILLFAKIEYPIWRLTYIAQLVVTYDEEPTIPGAYVLTLVILVMEQQLL